MFSLFTYGTYHFFLVLYNSFIKATVKSWKIRRLIWRVNCKKRKNVWTKFNHHYFPFLTTRGHAIFNISIIKMGITKIIILNRKILIFNLLKKKYDVGVWLFMTSLLVIFICLLLQKPTKIQTRLHTYTHTLITV